MVSEWIISVDDHVLEPPNTWTSRVPAKYRDVAPHLEVRDGIEAWCWEDKAVPTLGIVAVVGQDQKDRNPSPIKYEEMRPACFDPVERVKDMDTAGVLAQTLFPSMPRFCGQAFTEMKDRELGLLCVQAWNDFMIDEWSASAPGRYIPLAMVPLWDPHLAAKEAERAINKGARGILFSENPWELGLPSIHSADQYWDPLFSLANETGLPICIHIGSSSKLPITADDAPSIIALSLAPLNLIRTLHDYMFSGLFFKFPNLKITMAEGEIGWIPYTLQRMDKQVEIQPWSESGDYNFNMKEGNFSPKAYASGGRVVDPEHLPSRLFREHVYGCFLDDPAGLRLIDMIGVDNVMIETDYPHGDGTWPDSLAVAQRQLEGFSDEDRKKIMTGNACRLFQFEAAKPPF